jgi:hypothetical protein
MAQLQHSLWCIQCPTDAYGSEMNESRAIASVDMDQYTRRVDTCSENSARNMSRTMLFKPKMELKLVALLLVLIAALQPVGAVQIDRVRTELGMVLRLRGGVKDGDYGRFKSILQGGSFVGLDIRSGGGSLKNGLEIAEIVRDKGLVVYASRECYSVCAFIFFAAKERYIGRGNKIGVHSVSNQRGKEDAETARSTIIVSRLLAGLGIPHSIIGKIVATPATKITFLNDHELAGLNVHRGNPFRNHDGAMSAAPRQEASSVCDPGVHVETEATAHSGRRPCTTPVAHVGEP